jgi:hypothetical protein
MTDVLQCPYCVLRFSTQSELDQHKAIDHPNVDEGGPVEEAATPIPEEQPPQEAEPEPEKKGGWFKRLFGGS